MYITYDEYAAIYAPMEERLFNALAFDACRVMDTHTTGIDNVKKLRSFPPKDEYSSQMVKHCAAKLVNILHQIHEAEMAVAMGRGYTETEQGLQRRVISRLESGNEAISFSEAKTSNSSIDAAVADKSVRDYLLAETVWEYLRGVEDENGVNLLYMGRYPGRYLC